MNTIELDYQTLGLEPGASGVEIKQAYRDLVIIWHPDRFPGNPRLQKMATEKLKEVNLAYEKLMEYVDNSWYENLFGFEEEEFAKDGNEAGDAPPNSGKAETSDWTGNGEEFTRKDGKPADVQFDSENAETAGLFEDGSECTAKNGSAPDAQPNSDAETLEWLEKGFDSLEHGRLEEAISCFDKALEINPRLEKTWTAKGVILEKLGKIEEGLECFERALEIDERHEDAWVAKGNTLYTLFKNQEALDCYDRALVINPRNAEVWYRRWVALQKLGKYQELPGSLGKPLEMGLKTGDARYQRGVGSENTFSRDQLCLFGARMERSGDMSKDLIGDLSEVRLFNILKSLVDRRKSGMLAIEGKDSAELYIEGGSIVHCKTNGMVGEEAILAIMDFDEGQVTFNWQLSAEKQTVRTSTEQLMSAWNLRDEEWKKMREVMTSSDAVFSLVVDAGEDRTILANQWGVLALCDGNRSVSEIARLLGRSVLEVSKTISQMVDMGALVETGTPATSRLQKATVDEIFFADVETELTKVLGPIARVIINDTLAAFDQPRNAFPKDEVMNFIKTISDQIIDEEKRIQFENACMTLGSLHPEF